MSYWDWDNIGGCKYGSLYSTGSYIGCDYFAEDGRYYWRLFEFHGLVYMRKFSKKSRNSLSRYRVLSFNDIEVMKSNLINQGCKVNWETFDLANRLFSDMSINGYSVDRNTDYCSANKVVPFINV